MITGYRDRTPHSLPNAGALVNAPIFSGLPFAAVDSVSGLGAWRPMRYPGPAPMMTRRAAGLPPRLPGLILGQSARTIRSYTQPHPPLTAGQAGWLAGLNRQPGARVGIVGWHGQGSNPVVAPFSPSAPAGAPAQPARPASSPGGSGRLSGLLNLFSRK